MPRFNVSGDWCAGVGGDGVYLIVNGRIVDPGPGGAGDWLNDDEITTARWTSYEDFRAVAMSKAGLQRELRHGVVEHVYAGGGRWATLGQGRYILDDGTESLPIVGFGRDGCLVTWASGSSGLIIAGRTVSDAVVYESHVIDARTAIWLEPDGPHTIGMPVPQLLPGPVHGLRVAFDGWWWWALYQAEYNGQLVLHPFDSFHGHALTAPYDPHNSATWAYRPDLLIFDGVKQVIWATIESEQIGQIAGPYVVTDAQFPPRDLSVLPEPVQPPPQITVTHYDHLFKAGLPWVLEFTNSDGTSFTVSKDAQDRLWIAAQNAAGSTSTGQVRQLTVEGPSTPEPEPPMPTLGRFWLQPNIGSLDEAVLPGNLAGVDVVAIPIQQILTDEVTDQLGPNTYPNLVAVGFFTALKDAGTPLVVEMGSVKPYNCQATDSISGMQEAVQRVMDAGGVIAGFSADEPLTANQVPLNQGGCQQSLELCADAHANWTHAIRTLGGMQVGWLEAWPEVSLADMQTFLYLLQARDALPDYWHLDIDWHRSGNDTKTAAFIYAAQQTANQYGLTLGGFINSTVDPIPTDVQHHQNLLALAAKLYGIVPDIAQVHVASWAHRVSPDPTHKTQNVPNNLGAKGLLDTFTQVRTIFGSIHPPEPEPPVVEGPMSAYGSPMLGFNGGVLEPHPDNDGTFAVHKPNGYWLCVTPDGSVEQRPNDGTPLDQYHPGLWEKFRKAKNGASLIAERDGQRIYVLALCE